MFLYFRVFSCSTRWLDFMCFPVLWCFGVLMFNCVSTTMSRIVNLHFLDLMEVYHCVAVWTPSTSVCDICILQRLLSSVFRGINKGCAKTSCLYSSTRVSTSWEVLVCCSWQDTGVYHGHPPLEHRGLPAESPNPLSLGPVHKWTTMNICCHPLRLESECSSCWLEGVQHLGSQVNSNTGDKCIYVGSFCVAQFWNDFYFWFDWYFMHLPSSKVELGCQETFAKGQWPEASQHNLTFQIEPINSCSNLFRLSR